MDYKGQALYQVLLQRHSLEEQRALLQKLPSSENFKPQPLASAQLPPLFSPEGWLQKIHYSWLLTPLSTFSPYIQSLYLGLFPSPIKAKLSTLLKIKPSEKQNTLVAPFLLSILKESVIGKELSEATLLPLSPSQPLLSLQKENLVALIDLLGVYDLAYTIKHVIDKDLLSRILSSLTHSQRKFLDLCRTQLSKVGPAHGINLKNWDGSKRQLRHFIHRCGLKRLADAVKGENNHFIWHLCHHLDTGRAKILHECLLQNSDAQTLALHKAQVLKLIQKIL